MKKCLALLACLLVNAPANAVRDDWDGGWGFMRPGVVITPPVIQLPQIVVGPPVIYPPPPPPPPVYYGYGPGYGYRPYGYGYGHHWGGHHHHERD